MVSGKGTSAQTVILQQPRRQVSRTLPARRGLDGVHSERSFLVGLKQRSPWDSARRMRRKAELLFRRVRRTMRRITPDLAPRKALYASLMGGVAFGIVSMAFIEHFFGPGVFARSEELTQSQSVETAAVTPEASSAPAAVEKIAYDGESDIFLEYFDEAAKEEYEDNIRRLVKGHPIEAMLPYIFEKDRVVAAFLIGIAKKESNWGKRVPVLDGQDCFNYWGYRGVRRMMGTGGHTCFNSRKDAVDTVAKRIEKLVYSEKLNTPEKMVLWKCGFSCAGHSRESVKKWISDVDMYYEQLKDE